MRILATDPLFALDKLDDDPSLKTVAFVLDMLADEKLIAALQAHRGKGRDDFPVHILWRVHVVRYLLRHPTMDACLAELGRNPALRRVVGLEQGQKIPSAWNMSRFLEVLGMEQHLELVKRMFVELTSRLGKHVGDLGVHVAGDSAALSARGDGDPSSTTLPQPDGGRKEYSDEQGKVVKVYEWFGYKFHLLVDVKHEVVLAYRLTAATVSDAGQIPLLLEDAAAVLPEGRIKTLAYDKAADDVKTHSVLHEKTIRPLIRNRSLWKQELERMLPGHDGKSNVVYDEAGTVFCYDTISVAAVKRQMAYVGYEKSRGTLKYRCPARHHGFKCPSDKRCNGNSGYGKTVRVKCETDLRRFPPIPRATIEFERRYKGRTAIERVNARIKLFWGADDGNVTGARRFHAHLNTIMLVHASFANVLAMADRYEGKSLSPVRLGEIQRRLRKAAERSGPAGREARGG